MTKKQIGKLGEDIACIFMKRRGFTVIDRNFYRKWGEIDIVAREDGQIYFIEVKTVTCFRAVNHETSKGLYRAEENINAWKLRKLGRIIQTYLHKHNLQGVEWAFMAVIVYLNEKQRNAKVYMIKDIVI